VRADGVLVRAERFNIEQEALLEMCCCSRWDAVDLNGCTALADSELWDGDPLRLDGENTSEQPVTRGVSLADWLDEHDLIAVIAGLGALLLAGVHVLGVVEAEAGEPVLLGILGGRGGMGCEVELPAATLTASLAVGLLNCQRSISELKA
jgi:hypothetical protein